MRNFHALIGAVLILFSIALPRPAWAANTPSSKPEVTVGIVLFDGVQIIDFAGPYEVFGASGFGVVTLTRDGKPITTTMGLKVTPDHDFASAPNFDILLVPGGTVADAQKDPAILDFIRSRAAGVDHVLSVCTGAFILAETGLLDGLQATTFTPRIDQLSREFPDVDVISDVRWADNGKIITSAGLSSGMDAALHVVARERGIDFARSVAFDLEYDWQHEGGFIRSLLADRYMPTLKGVVWPKNTKFDRHFSVGDKQHWRMRFNVTSPASADTLMGLIVDDIQSTGDWTRTAATDAYRWEAELENRHVVLTFKTTPSDTAGSFGLDVTIIANDTLPVSPPAP